MRLRLASLVSVLVLALTACSGQAAAPAKPTEPAKTAATQPPAKASEPAAKPTEAAAQPAAKPTEAAPAAAAPGVPVPKTSSGYPARPISIIVPYTAGGGSDIMIRALDKIAADLKLFPQNFVISNVTGGSGFTGKQQAISRPPDGYTLTVFDDATISGQVLGLAPMTYNDFTYVSRLVVEYNMVAVRTESPFKTLREWLDAAKARPKEVSVGGTGIGLTDQVQLAQIEKRADVRFNYVSYDGGGQVLTSLLGGQLDAAMLNPGEAFEQLRAGSLRVLGVSSPERLKDMPDVPTWKEGGVDYVGTQFRGIAGPKGLPADVVAYLDESFKRVSDSPAWNSDYLDRYQQVNGYLSSADSLKLMEESYREAEMAFQELDSLKNR